MDWLAVEAFTGQLDLLREIVTVQGRSFPGRETWGYGYIWLTGKDGFAGYKGVVWEPGVSSYKEGREGAVYYSFWALANIHGGQGVAHGRGVLVYAFLDQPNSVIMPRNYVWFCRGVFTLAYHVAKGVWFAAEGACVVGYQAPAMEELSVYQASPAAFKHGRGFSR